MGSQMPQKQESEYHKLRKRTLDFQEQKIV